MTIVSWKAEYPILFPWHCLGFHGDGCAVTRGPPITSQHEGQRVHGFFRLSQEEKTENRTWRQIQPLRPQRGWCFSRISLCGAEWGRGEWPSRKTGKYFVAWLRQQIEQKARERKVMKCTVSGPWNDLQMLGHQMMYTPWHKSLLML